MSTAKCADCDWTVEQPTHKAAIRALEHHIHDEHQGVDF